MHVDTIRKLEDAVKALEDLVKDAGPLTAPEMHDMGSLMRVAREGVNAIHQRQGSTHQYTGHKAYEDLFPPLVTEPIMRPLKVEAERVHAMEEKAAMAESAKAAKSQQATDEKDSEHAKDERMKHDAAVAKTEGAKTEGQRNAEGMAHGPDKPFAHVAEHVNPPNKDLG